MAVTSRPIDPGSRASSSSPDPGPAARARGICPYLIGDGGTWRSAVPARHQQCGAVHPPSLLTVDKQRDLCVAEKHVTCGTYVAARGAPVAAAPGDHQADADSVTRWALVRTTPVVLDEPRVRAVADLADRRRTVPRAAVGGLLALALGAIVLARLPGAGAAPAGALAAASPSPSAPAAASPARAATRPPSFAPPASPSAITATPVVSATPHVTPSPVVRTYRVVAGDNHYTIAARHGTTIKAIVDLNGLSSTELRIGQVLKLP